MRGGHARGGKHSSSTASAPDGPARLTIIGLSLVVIIGVLVFLAGRQPGGLPAAGRALAQQMMEDSSNDAATTLWNAVGGASGIRSFNAVAGLSGTTPSSCVQCPGFPWPGWGLSTTTPLDQITLLRELVEPAGVISAATVMGKTSIE